MTYVILPDESGFILAKAVKTQAATGDTVISKTEFDSVPDDLYVFGTPVYKWTEGAAVRDLSLVAADAVKAALVLEVKAAASGRLTATDWKVTRARDKIDAGLIAADDPDFLGLLAERQAIRDASNTAEMEIAAITEVEKLMAYEVAF